MSPERSKGDNHTLVQYIFCTRVSNDTFRYRERKNDFKILQKFKNLLNRKEILAYFIYFI